MGRVGRAFVQAGNGASPLGVVAITSDQVDAWLTVDETWGTSAGADQLAAQLRQAIDDRDAARVRELLAQIALHEGDPVWLAQFFQELGPDDTLMCLSASQNDPQAVQTFDTALANATNSPNWDPSFTKQLFDWHNHMGPLLEEGGLRAHLITLLLQYGTCSEDFLTHAGDALLFEVHSAGFPQDSPFSTFMTALARNPAAWHQLPDSVRQDIANHIADDIGDFEGTGLDYSSLDSNGKKWVHTMESLFTMAEMDDTGHIDQARQDELKQAVRSYLGSVAPSYGTKDPGAWEGWLNDAGTMSALVALPMRKVGYTQAQIAAKQADVLSIVLDDVGSALPGDGPFVHHIKRLIADSIAHVLAQGPGDPAGEDELIMDVDKQQLTHLAAVALAVNDPTFLPASLRDRKLDDPDVQAYLVFAESYVSLPDRLPPELKTLFEAHPDWQPTFKSNAGLLNTLRASTDQQLDPLFGTQG